MEVLKFANGLKVSEDGRTICLPNGTIVKLGEDGKVLSAEKDTLVHAILEYPFTHFDFIGEKERIKVAQHFARGKEIYKNDYERRFYQEVTEAAAMVKYDYYLAKYPASVDSKGRIYYKEGARVATGYKKEDWEIMAKQFYPQYNSDIATLYEYLLWIGYSILQNRWTIEAWCTENGLAEDDVFLHTRKLVRHKGEFIRCGYNKCITRSPARVPLKITYGGFYDFNCPNPCIYTGIVALRP